MTAAASYRIGAFETVPRSCVPDGLAPQDSKHTVGASRRHALPLWMESSRRATTVRVQFVVCTNRRALRLQDVSQLNHLVQRRSTRLRLSGMRTSRGEVHGAACNSSTPRLCRRDRGGPDSLAPGLSKHIVVASRGRGQAAETGTGRREREREHRPRRASHRLVMPAL